MSDVVLNGRGNADHPLLCFVGMNPGREEVKQGVPFVGPSGKLLSSILRDLGIDEKEVYFTNAVKEATPSNREPTAAEAKKWRKEFTEEIAKVSPRVLVPLGNFSLKEVSGRSGISRRIGIPQKPHGRFALDNCIVVPCFHPAYALRNPSATNAIKETIAFALRIARGEETKIEPKIIWVEKLKTKRAIRNVCDKISEEKVLVYDIETNARGFDDPAFSVYLIGIDAGEWTYVFGPTRDSILMGATLLVPGSSRQTFAGHNAIRFDSEGLSRILPATRSLVHVSEDTMLLDYLLDENAGSHALEPVAHRILGCAESKSAVTWSWHDTPPEEIPWLTAVEYVARDAKVTRLIYDALRARIDQDPGLLRVYDILRAASSAFTQIERNGVYIDLPYIRQQTTECETRIKNLRGRLIRDTLNPDFNPNAPRQVVKALEVMGLSPTKRTKTGKPSGDEESLKLMKARATDSIQSDFIDALLEYRMYAKRVSTYFKSYLEHETLDENSRIHPGYGLTTTVSGRTSSFRPNFENIPREPSVRKIIAAAPGRTLLGADYSQLELRVASDVSQEENMLAAFARGEDLHKLFAQKITGREEITKEERYAAKVANFLLLYGGEEYTFQKQALLNYDLYVSDGDARRYRAMFHEQWPGLEKWYRRVSTEILDTGQTRSITGQLRRLPGIYASDTMTRLEALRSGLNFTIQNPAAIIGIVAATMLVQAFQQDKEVKVVGFVHDSVMLEIPPERVEEIATKVIDVMERGVVELLRKEGICVGVPLKADIEVGPSWGAMSPLERNPQPQLETALPSDTPN
jgi:uracil-DNA glycosylase family 4